MPRAYDDRPVAGDTGYIERPRPALSRLGQELVRQVLDLMNAAYTLNFENDTITIESPKDFFRTLDVLARQGKVSTMRLDFTPAAGEDGSEMSFTARGGAAGSIRLRLAGELADVALQIGAVKPAGAGAVSYAVGTFNDQLFLRTLADRDPNLNIA